MKLNSLTTWTSQKVNVLLLFTLLQSNKTKGGPGFENCIISWELVLGNYYSSLLSYPFDSNSVINSGGILKVCCNTTQCSPSPITQACSNGAGILCNKLAQSKFCHCDSVPCAGIVGNTTINSNTTLGNCPKLNEVANYLANTSTSATYVNNGGKYAIWTCPPPINNCAMKWCYWDNNGWTCPSYSNNVTNIADVNNDCLLQWEAPFPNNTVPTVNISTPNNSDLIKMIITGSASFLIGGGIGIGTTYFYWRKQRTVESQSIQDHHKEREEILQSGNHLEIQENTNPLNLKNLSFSENNQIKPTLERSLGRGGYGEVWYGKWDLQEVAIKKLYLLLSNISESDLKDVKKEIKILKNLRNKYIIQYYDTYSDNQELLIIMEYAENGALNEFIDKNRGKNHNWNYNTSLIKQIILGLAYIHQKGVIHRDLKSMNILLTSNYQQAKISDFGLSKIKTISSSQSKHGAAGTLRWMAPELLRKDKNPEYSEGSDIYALGMIIWEIVAKCTTPFEDINDNRDLLLHIINGGKETIPNDTSQNIQNIIQQCWKDNPNERITLKRMLESIESDKSELQTINNDNKFLDVKNLPKIQNNDNEEFWAGSRELDINNIESIQENLQEKSSIKVQIEQPPK